MANRVKVEKTLKKSVIPPAPIKVIILLFHSKLKHLAGEQPHSEPITFARSSSKRQAPCISFQAKV